MLSSKPKLFTNYANIVWKMVSSMRTGNRREAKPSVVKRDTANKVIRGASRPVNGPHAYLLLLRTTKILERLRSFRLGKNQQKRFYGYFFLVKVTELRKIGYKYWLNSSKKSLYIFLTNYFFLIEENSVKSPN